MINDKFEITLPAADQIELTLEEASRIVYDLAVLNAMDPADHIDDMKAEAERQHQAIHMVYNHMAQFANDTPRVKQ